MRHTLFGDKEFYYSPYPSDYHDKNHWTTEEIAAIVFRDMEKQLTKEEIVDELSSGHLSGSPKYPYGMYSHSDWKTEEGKQKIRKVMDKYNEDVKSHAEDVADKLLEKTKGKKLFHFTYADDEGHLGSAMEHGTLFDNVECQRISNH